MGKDTIKIIKREGLDLEVGWEYFPQRKKPQIVIREPGKSISLGSFRDEESASKFFDTLAKIIGV